MPSGGLLLGRKDIKMSDVIINPGSGECECGTWGQAYANMKQFIEDCEIPMHIIRADFIPDDGRYLFVIGADNFKYESEIEMPGLPIEKVRYMSADGQNPFDFPRLYVDGSSWLWKFAIITKEQIKDYFNKRIAEMQYDMKTYSRIVESLDLD